MKEAILKGVLAGLAYGMLLGPLFFLGLQVTLRRGLRNGLALAAGAFISDALLAAGGWWSAARLLALVKEAQFQSVVGLIGALLIIGFGISALRPHKESGADLFAERPAKRRYSFMKGFALNMANPSNWLFWLGLAAAAGAEAPEGIRYYTLVFLGAALSMVLTTDVAKIILAGKVGARLPPGLPGRIVQLAGAVLIAVGTWVLYKIIQGLL